MNNSIEASQIEEDVNKCHQLQFFAKRVVNPWDALARDAVEATSINMFNNNLDLHLASNQDEPQMSTEKRGGREREKKLKADQEENISR